MFTGIVTDLGEVRRIVRGEGREARFEIASAYDTGTIAIGASIAHNGVCLTIIEVGPDWHAVEASAETLSKTTLGSWREGSKVNLERALKVGDELGGHIVSGHVDGVARVVDIRPENESLRFTFETPADLACFVAPKGSVALDGVSLTVNEVDGRRFGINVIPHTQSVTTFGTYRPGDEVNMEIDMLARYVARLLQRE
ncbi:Riboflavin synthase subunit alpha [Paramagnetospirillum caucaseum]|uniref:Riboflavin synthase n=1 Tax=Paramagnetospirillum caucaseum TaxID=1244869 RepID=M2Y9S9_9PROT|nr:riboflavin synthase [Paramagnetospirillum caucaseum]EME69781.1 Riboflavin synthase subunit alpha [Paramagnetospirillum caucaseum]